MAPGAADEGDGEAVGGTVKVRGGEDQADDFEGDGLDGRSGGPRCGRLSKWVIKTSGERVVGAYLDAR